MIPLVADTSVLIKWFHTEGEREVEAAHALLQAHRAERIDVRLLDLAIYELGNILLRKLKWSARRVADQLDDVQVLCGRPFSLEPEWRRQAAALAERHALTLYDAAFAAAAQGMGASLVSADQQLLVAGLAESVSMWVERIGP